ncbi:MAG: pentapeptide repeat-containing protein, partial [Cyanobacteria bacterium]|nr:pentapeptide repeat-containing protein [Cyanobacteriota bacterium]
MNPLSLFRELSKPLIVSQVHDPKTGKLYQDEPSSAVIDSGEPLRELNAAPVSSSSVEKVKQEIIDCYSNPQDGVVNLTNIDWPSLTQEISSRYNTPGSRLEDVLKALLKDIHEVPEQYKEHPLSNVNLTRADLRGVNLSDANLSNADLYNVNLSRANLTDADLAPVSSSSVEKVKQEIIDCYSNPQ